MSRGMAGIAAVIVLATLAAYVPAIRGGWVWDDDIHVTRNRNLQDLAGLTRIWLTTSATPQYYPLTHTTFWIERHLYGLDPLGYHLDNVLLHAASAILLALVLETLGVPGAWLAAAVFALHPVHVESVAWITERKNALSGLLYLGSALVFLRHFAGGGDRDRTRYGPPAAAVALFVAGLLAKTVIATLPVALAIVLLWKRGRIERRAVPWLAAMIAVGATLGLLTAWLEATQVGAEGREFSLTFAERLLLAGRAVLFYLGKLSFPHPLAFLYPRWTLDARSAAQWLFPVAAAGAAAALWFARKRIGTAPLAAYAFYVVTLGPALGFLNVYPMRFSFTADHFQYLASIGPIALVSAGAARLAERLPRVVPRWAWAAPPLLALALLTWRQGGAYRDLDTLWTRTIEASPDSFMAHYNLGKMLAERGRTDEAFAHYQEALRANPEMAEAMINLANQLADRGKLEEAVDLYGRVIRLDPGRERAHYDLALALEQLKRPGEAEKAYRDAIRVKPGMIAAHNNLAVLLFQQGRYAEAWGEVHASLRSGGKPHPEFLRALTDRMPDPGP
ncbi:MAG: tetratricopeptide repeat protein [Acidobacteriia bacterium]|nr:tetratricopeptide repeat protein [Terriglobia bacterium]